MPLALMVAEHIQGWLPMKATDPNSHHEITQLDEGTPEASTPPRPGQASSSVKPVLPVKPRPSSAHSWAQRPLRLHLPLIQRAGFQSLFNPIRGFWTIFLCD
jgi:hypothetical protein